MSKLFDNVCRILGSAMPRRRALRVILGGLAGGGLAHLWPTRVSAGQFWSPISGCWQGDGDGWVSTEEGCKDTQTGVTWSRDFISETGSSGTWTWTKNVACPDLGPGWRLPTIAEWNAALAHNFKDHNDNRRTWNHARWASDLTCTKKKQQGLNRAVTPLDSTNRCYGGALTFFCVKQ